MQPNKDTETLEERMIALKHELLKACQKLEQKLTEGRPMYSLIVSVNAINVITIEIQKLQEELNCL